MTLQAFFGAATVAALLHLGSGVFGNRVANVAGLVWALNPVLLSLPVIFWETSLSTLLCTALLAASQRRKRDSSGRWIAFGILSGMTLMINPALLSVVACCFLWRAWRSRGAGRWKPLLGASTALLLCVPWAVRNERALHAFIPFRSNAGYELWQGNRPGADGFFNAQLHPNVNADEFRSYIALGEIAYMQQKTDLAWDTIRNRPDRFLELTAQRIFHFWTGAGRAPSSLLVVCICFTSAFGVGGLVRLSRRRPGEGLLLLLPVLFFPLPYYLTHPDFRFRLVLDPLLTLSAVWFIHCLARSPRTEPG